MAFKKISKHEPGYTVQMSVGLSGVMEIGRFESRLEAREYAKYIEALGGDKKINVRFRKAGKGPRGKTYDPPRRECEKLEIEHLEALQTIFDLWHCID